MNHKTKTMALMLLLLFSVASFGQPSFHINSCDTVYIAIGAGEESPVRQATAMLEGDIMRTLSSPVAYVERGIGKSPFLIIETSPEAFPQGSHQAFRLSITSEGALLVQGSDRLGTAFGTLEVSRRLGVSPWEWWAEAEVPTLKEFSLDLTNPICEAPYVEHRGIFINDEDWSLAPWATSQELATADIGGKWKHRIGNSVTERLCQLLLRLRADTYWPAMHEGTQPFFLTDGNRQIAERYGIYIGTSHCEPMACNALGEWAVRGNGDYNFATNAEAVTAFWQQRIDETARQPIIYTLGMRGIHDGAMQGASTKEEQKTLLEDIFLTQQNILRNALGDRYARAPQVFIPYKEVLETVDAGLHIPQDVAVIQCDDNYGYIRWPADTMLTREAGTGLYYHVSYWGRPHDYLWLSTTHPRVMQMELVRFAYAGRQRLWVLNVGDLKPAEYQTQLFMDIAWNPAKFTHAEAWREHLASFLSENVGQSMQTTTCLTENLVRYYDIVFACRPEFLAGTRTEETDQKWKHASDLPWSCHELTAYCSSLLSLSDSVNMENPTTAWMHLVQYPVQGSAQMAVKHVSATLARHGLADWETCDRAHDSIQILTERGYNSGRWQGFMDASPRGLTVFRRVVRDTATAPLAEEVRTFLDISFVDSLVALSEERPFLPINFFAPLVGGEQLTVEISVLPTHPRHSQRLSLAVSLDGCAPTTVDFTTQGRSEEWKRNVLFNRSTREITLSAADVGAHVLTLSYVSGGEIYPLRVRVLPFVR